MGCTGMSRTCQECGGNRFTLELGEKVCEECGVVLAGYMETQSQETFGMVDRSRLIAAGKVMQDSDSSHEGSGDEGTVGRLSNWTSYEMYNIVLHAWTKAMCKLGASDKFRPTVLKLWIAYLHRLEVAFFDPKSVATKTPKLSFMPHRRDVMLLNKGKDSVTAEDLSSRVSNRSCRGKLSGESELDKIKRKIENKKIRQEVRTGKKSEVISHAVASELSRTLTDFDISSTFNADGGEEEYDRSSLWGDQSLPTPTQSLKSFITDDEQGEADQSIMWGSKSSVAGDQCSVWESQSSQVSERKAEPKPNYSKSIEEYAVLSTVPTCRNSFVRKWLKNQKQICRFSNIDSDTENYMDELPDWVQDDGSITLSVCSRDQSSTSKRKRKSCFTDSDEDPNISPIIRSPACKKRKKGSVLGHKRNLKGSVHGHKSIKDRPSSIKGSKKGLKTRHIIWDANKRELRLSRKQKYYIRKIEPVHLTFSKLLGILYLAVLLAQEDIMLMDILRWCREGHIPYFSAQYLLPPSMRMFYEDLQLFTTLRRIPTAAEMFSITGNMAIFLSLREVPLPAPADIISKLVRALNLPESVGILSQELCRKVDLPDPKSMFILPPVECQAAASIVLVLKMMYGLNDWYEDRLSWTAQAVEKELEGEHPAPRTSHRLFSWDEWQRHMNAVVWLSCVVDPVSSAHYHGLLPKTGQPLPTFLAQSYWTNFIWNIPRTSQTRKKALQTLARRVLEARGESLEDVLRGDGLYQPSHLPLTGILHQFLSKHHRDTHQVIQQYVKFGDELMKKSFTFHSFDWMYHLSDVQEDLRARGSTLHLSTTTVHKDGYVDGCNHFFTSYQEDPAFIRPSTKKKNQGSGGEYYVPQPLEVSWTLSSVYTLDKKGNMKGRQIPASFRWLVKLMSLMCETSQWHIICLAKKMESMTIPLESQRKISRYHNKKLQSIPA